MENSGLSLPEIEISPISVRARNCINQLPCDANEGNRADSLVVTGFNVAQTLVQVLKQCGDNLARENVMKEAATLRKFRTTNLLPGITINTSPIDFAPIKQVQLRRFKGEIWELFGPVLSTEIGG